MVVMWCRKCGALIGLREPFVDWSTDATGLCPPCAGNMLRDRDQPKQPAEDNGDDGERKRQEEEQA